MNLRILPLILAAALLSWRPAAAAPGLVPTPRATELRITATNRPFLGAATARQPVSLVTSGYVEREYLLTGLAGIHEWDGTGASRATRLRTANLPYATRLLVRRPIDPQKFSGRVIVELFSAAGGFDTAPLWGLSAPYFLRSGDVWVGLTVKPSAAETLRRFDRLRYEGVSFAVPPPPGCKTDPADTDHGLAWDIIAQTGALLRSSSRENPLVDLDVRRLVAAGYAQAGGYVAAYVNVMHEALRLGNDRPIYDAYVDAGGAVGAAPINACAALLAAGDARRQILPRDAPVVTVMSQTDAARTQWMRRTDGDSDEDLYRLYEIAGMGHVTPFPAGQPSVGDARIAGLDSAAEVVCADPPSGFPAGLALNAIWQQLEDLQLRAMPLGKLPRIDVAADGAVQLDPLGNVLGGWRLPQLEVPLAVYQASSRPRADAPGTQGLCALTGSMRRLESPRLKTLYGNRAGYLKRFNAAVDAAVADRRMTAEDGAASKAQAARTAPTF